jgi:hypothetical protein
MSVYTLIALCHLIIELLKPIYKQPITLFRYPLLSITAHGLQGLPWAIIGINMLIWGLKKSFFSTHSTVYTLHVII